LYLVHPFSLVVAYKIAQYTTPNIDGNVFLLVAILFSVGTSYFVYELIEKPLTTYFKH